MPIHSNVSFILASASPRRKDLLRSAGLKFETIPAHVNEDYRDGESPAMHVRRLSRDKALALAARHPEAWVLGADTIVVIDDTILGKPKDRTQAKQMLGTLSGRVHKVLTGFTIACVSRNIRETGVVQSFVRFKKISPDEMAWYVSCDEPYDKAGGYAVQGKGAYFIKSIRGSYTNVVGLPLCEVLETLKKFKAIKF